MTEVLTLLLYIIGFIVIVPLVLVSLAAVIVAVTVIINAIFEK